MYCSHCGQEISSYASNCPHCKNDVTTGKGYCFSCGEPMRKDSDKCFNCGQPYRNKGKKLEGNIIHDGKSCAVDAALLSFFVPGLGQIVYLDQVAKGVFTLFLAIVVMLNAMYFCDHTPYWLWPIIGIPSMLDAYIIGGRLERHETVSKWKFF